jgi:hypothetical protein
MTMELEMYLKDRLLDHVPITKAQLEKLSAIQDKLEKKHHDEIAATRSLPKYFICGMPTSMIEKKGNSGKR